VYICGVISKFLILNITKMEDVKQLVEQIKAQYEAFAKDADALVNAGNKTAGARARKASLELDKLTKDFRKKSIEATK
jgi:hypothetical protein